MSEQYTGEVRLECGNLLYFETSPPRKGSEVWCRKHQKMEKVETAYRGKSYRIKCGKCRYGKSFGQGKLAAETAMVRHRQKRGMDHPMVLLDAQHTVIWRLDAAEMETLELPNY